MKPETNISDMSTVTTAYTLPVGGVIHPGIDISMNELASTMTRIHAQAVIGHTDYSYTPPAPLKLEASPVLLATNNRITEEESPTPLAYAELVFQNTKLSYITNGITHSLYGDAYIHFTYFTVDHDGQNFLNTFNAHPPHPPDAASIVIPNRDTRTEPITTEHYSDMACWECSEFPPIVNVNNRTTLNPLLTSSTRWASYCILHGGSRSYRSPPRSTSIASFSIAKTRTSAHHRWPRTQTQARRTTETRNYRGRQPTRAHHAHPARKHSMYVISYWKDVSRSTYTSRRTPIFFHHHENPVFDTRRLTEKF